MPRTNTTFAELITQAAKLSQFAAESAGRGEDGEALEYERQADELRARARAQVRPGAAKATQAKGSVRVAGSRRGESTRNLTISALSELGVPASPQAIAAYVAVRFGKRIDPKSLASLRRDEVRAWSSPRSSRTAFVVPALEGGRFGPSRGKFALSIWPLERRIISPWSERVDLLFAAKNLTRQYQWLCDADPAVGRELGRLIARHYAATIPGAIDDREDLDPTQVLQAVERELGAIGAEDECWRAEAARRAAETLSGSEQLWGLRPPDIALASQA